MWSKIRSVFLMVKSGAGYMGEILSKAEENIQSRKEEAVEPVVSLDSLQVWHEKSQKNLISYIYCSFLLWLTPFFLGEY